MVKERDALKTLVWNREIMTLDRGLKYDNMPAKHSLTSRQLFKQYHDMHIVLPFLDGRESFHHVSSFGLSVVCIALVLRLEPEILVCRTEKHLTVGWLAFVVRHDTREL